MVGCVPCKDGWFSSANDANCTKCAVGKYSTQTSHRDLFRCPTPGLPSAATVEWLYHNRVQSDRGEAIQGYDDFNVTVGAKQCTDCPPGYTTKGVASVSLRQCTRCSREQYYQSVQGSASYCQSCTPPCQSPYQFETKPCTDESDRVCTICDRSQCRLGEYVTECLVDLTTPDAKPNTRGCGKCTNAPDEGGVYTAQLDAGSEKCPWECKQVRV